MTEVTIKTTAGWKTAWMYDPLYYANYCRNINMANRTTGGGFSTSGNFFTSGEVFIPATPVFEPEELHCKYCGRKHARGKETCAGCGAPL